MKKWRQILLFGLCVGLLTPLAYGQGVQPIEGSEAPPVVENDSLKLLSPLPPSILLHMPPKLSLPEVRYPSAPIPGIDLFDSRAVGRRQQEHRQSLWSNRWKLQSALHEGFGGHNMGYNAMVHAMEKQLTLSYQVNNSLSLSISGLMGYTSLPQAIYADQRYEVSAGLTYRFNERNWIKAGVSAGRFITSNYVNPHFSTTHLLNDNLRFDTYGGISFNTQAFAPTPFAQRSLYVGGQLTYTADNGLFVYGRGNTSFSQQPLYGWSPNPHLWNSSFGGGIGYNLPGGMPISMGVDYVRNPVTGKYQPVFSLNLIGGLIYLIKAAIEAVSE